MQSIIANYDITSSDDSEEETKKTVSLPSSVASEVELDIMDESKKRRLVDILNVHGDNLTKRKCIHLPEDVAQMFSEQGE